MDETILIGAFILLGLGVLMAFLGFGERNKTLSKHDLPRFPRSIL